MSALDLSNPAHEADLRWACAASPEDRDWIAKSIEVHPWSVTAKMCIALSSPALAADLIRQLVERAGAKWYLTTTKLGVAFYRDKPHRREEEEFWFACHELPFLITRLLDIAHNAGAVEALKALRGEV